MRWWLKENDEEEEIEKNEEKKIENLCECENKASSFGSIAPDTSELQRTYLNLCTGRGRVKLKLKTSQTLFLYINR